MLSPLLSTLAPTSPDTTTQDPMGPPPNASPVEPTSLTYSYPQPYLADTTLQTATTSHVVLPPSPPLPPPIFPISLSSDNTLSLIPFQSEPTYLVHHIHLPQLQHIIPLIQVKLRYGINITTYPTMPSHLLGHHLLL
ncbi:hypothetical protein L3X38_041548 [Prunus dulcis]|uniref:Uncharacterized protein n=1 Tax=Prunus dulcis TaxID=3755 RepID=A0AAD4USW6_PRUDU|nr:hypothetical protein L3X38_041548 [Prunus dulcis]